MAEKTAYAGMERLDELILYEMNLALSRQRTGSKLEPRLFEVKSISEFLQDPSNYGLVSKSVPEEQVGMVKNVARVYAGFIGDISEQRSTNQKYGDVPDEEFVKGVTHVLKRYSERIRDSTIFSFWRTVLDKALRDLIIQK